MGLCNTKIQSGFIFVHAQSSKSNIPLPFWLPDVQLKPTGPNNTLLCCIYTIATIVVTTISKAIVVAKGLTGPRNTSTLAATSEVYCNKFFHSFASSLSSLFATLQVIAFISTIILYLLLTKIKLSW